MYYNGNFSTWQGLINSVRAALQANGWSLNGDAVLVKNGMNVRLEHQAESFFLVQCGTGSAPYPEPLPGGAPKGVKMMSWPASPINFPATYELHVFTDPDEVYLVINYNADKYQQVSWGRTQVSQVGGLGAWFTGSFHEEAPNTGDIKVYTSAGTDAVGFGWGGMGCGLFFDAYSAPLPTSYMHTGLDTTGWKKVSSGNGNMVGSGDPVAALLQALPSQFNQSTVLLPLMAVQRRLSQGQTIAADMVNARLCRIDNHLPGEIVTYGTDRWKVYPFHRKNADQRNGVPWITGANHSGTFGYAIRYSGP